MTLGQELDDVRAQFESSGTLHNGLKTIIEIFDVRRCWRDRKLGCETDRYCSVER
jgi:hypothetical protein